MSEGGDMPADPGLCPGADVLPMIAQVDPFEPYLYAAARPRTGCVALVGGPYPIELSRFQAENLRDALGEAINLLDQPGELPK